MSTVESKSRSKTNLAPFVLPAPFAGWFAGRRWQPRLHQLALVEAAAACRSTLLIAPTGAGKTLAGFLPSLIELAAQPANEPRLHTLYVSPLKALAVDVQRNLLAPVREMQLQVRIETRTGDTPAGRRQRQRYIPPDILLTTPEQIALLISHGDEPRMFGSLKAIILDLKVEHPPLRVNQIATICYVRTGRRPDDKTIKRVLAENELPHRPSRRFPLYHQITDPTERRATIIRLHFEGSGKKAISAYLQCHRDTVHATLRRWATEVWGVWQPAF